jgi:hypothetical protein
MLSKKVMIKKIILVTTIFGGFNVLSRDMK